MRKAATKWVPVVMLALGMAIGWGGFRLMNPPLAPTSPTIGLGSNDGRIISFDVSAWPTPNFLFQQEGHLPVVLFPAVGEATPLVTLLDGRVMTYQEFINDFQSTGGETYSHALFTVDYRENDVDELGYVMSIKQTR